MMNESTTKKELKFGEVWKESFGIIWYKPIVLLPTFIVLLFAQLLGILMLLFIVLPEGITSIKDMMPFIPSQLPAKFMTIIWYILLLTLFLLACILCWLKISSNKRENNKIKDK